MEEAVVGVAVATEEVVEDMPVMDTEVAVAAAGDTEVAAAGDTEVVVVAAVATEAAAVAVPQAVASKATDGRTMSRT
jgi:hypothetical protein